MRLCVGAASRRVVEEAAKLQVHQIVASRRQVNAKGGYIGLNQPDLVTLVKELSRGETHVVRDHGGPLQGGTHDDGRHELEQDLAAGFDGLHIDVCQLDRYSQLSALRSLVQSFSDRGCYLEIGGEADDQPWLDQLVRVALDAKVRPLYAVVDTGSRIWMDRQCGSLHDRSILTTRVNQLHATGIFAKCHNADWLGDRNGALSMFDAYNVAPEFAEVEVEAILMYDSARAAYPTLQHAHDTGAWRRWFADYQGTWLARAKCALRYSPLHERATGVYADELVRKAIRDAISCG